MQITFADFFLGQLWGPPVPPVVTKNLEGQTVVVTGANIGIGFEAAKHFARMNPGKLILACRDQKKGDAAVLKIKEETGFERIELWLLDLAIFASVKSFADRFDNEESRLDILVENAAILPNLEGKFETTVDGWEPALQVNNLSTSLLALRLLPKMLATAEQYQTTPRLVVVSSEVHYWTKLDRNVIGSDNPLEIFGRSAQYVPTVLKSRYLDSKLLNVLFTRALNDRLAGQPLIVNSVNPGYCYSGLRRDFKGVQGWIDWVMEKLIARTTEEGSRMLVWAALGGDDKIDELRGAFVSLCQVLEPSDYVISEEGKQAQNVLWRNQIEELIKVDPKVANIAKLHLTTQA